MNNKIEIEGVDLIIYMKNGNNITLGLSDSQLAVIVKSLGLQFADDHSYYCFDDKLLKRFIKREVNPFDLVPVD